MLYLREYKLLFDMETRPRPAESVEHALSRTHCRFSYPGLSRLH